MRKKYQQQGVHYGNMTPTDTNNDTKTKIQTPTPGGSDNVTSNQGASGSNQGTNREYWYNTRGQKQKNRGINQHSIRYQIINVAGFEESFKVLLSSTESRYKVQYIKFKSLIITHIFADFKKPADIMKLIKNSLIPIIPLPASRNFMNEYGFTNSDTLITEGK